MASKAWKTIVLNASAEARTNETLLQAMEEHNGQLTTGSSAV